MTATIPLRSFLYLRHGETDWNASGLAQGRTDIPLNAIGRAQADAASRVLAECPIDRIVSSPLSRARETASIVGDRLGLSDLVLDPGLVEVSFGAEEGKPMGSWYEDWLDGTMTPENGESFAELGARGAQALSRHLDADGLVLFVAHGALFRAIRAVLGLPIHVRLANGAPMRCRATPDGWSIAPASPPIETVERQGRT